MKVREEKSKVQRAAAHYDECVRVKMGIDFAKLRIERNLHEVSNDEYDGVLTKLERAIVDVSESHTVLMLALHDEAMNINEIIIELLAEIKNK
jgi:hypothetical protein